MPTKPRAQKRTPARSRAAQPPVPNVWVDAYQFLVQTPFTVGEALLFERTTGRAFAETIVQVTAGTFTAEALRATILIASRRANPEMTLEEIDKLDLASIEFRTWAPPTD